MCYLYIIYDIYMLLCCFNEIIGNAHASKITVGPSFEVKNVAKNIVPQVQHNFPVNMNNQHQLNNLLQHHFNQYHHNHHHRNRRRHHANPLNNQVFP